MAAPKRWRRWRAREISPWTALVLVMKPPAKPTTMRGGAEATGDGRRAVGAGARGTGAICWAATGDARSAGSAKRKVVTNAASRRGRRLAVDEDNGITPD